MTGHLLEYVEEVDVGFEAWCVCGWSGHGMSEFDAVLNFAHGHGGLLVQKPEVRS